MTGGVGFALANVLLATVLTSAAFGVVSLFLALNQLGLTLGPLGIELSINRQHLKASRALLSMALTSAALIGIGIALIAHVFYDLSYAVTLCMAVAASASA